MFKKIYWVARVYWKSNLLITEITLFPGCQYLKNLSILSVEVRLTMQGFSLEKQTVRSIGYCSHRYYGPVVLCDNYVKLIIKYNLDWSVVVNHQLKPLLVITEGRCGGWDGGNWENKLSWLAAGWTKNIKPEFTYICPMVPHTLW